MNHRSTARRSPLRATALVAVLAVGLGAATAAAQPRRAASWSTVRTGVLDVLRTARLLGPAASRTVMSVTVVLRPQDASAEDASFRTMYAGGLADRPLSPEQFRARFGLSPERRAAARSFLTGHGLRVLSVYGAGDVWSLSGTVRQIDATFGVHVMRYDREGRRFLATSGPARVPSALGVESIVGLDTWFRFMLPAATPHRAETDCLDPVGCVGMVSARDLWSVYDMPVKYQGRGESIGILGEGESAGPIADLRLFEQANRLPAVPVRVVHTDGAKGAYSDVSGRDEWAMDLEAASSMAPAARQLTMYFGGSLLNVSLLDDIASWAADAGGPRQASMSITECEDSPVSVQTGAFTATPDFVVAADRLLRQATLEGRTLFASSGDLGSSCSFVPGVPVNVNGVANEGVPLVEYPASSPYVVGVGGTVLYATAGASAHRVAELGWTGSGGGQSVTYSQPTYQQHVAPPGLGSRPCLQQASGGTASPTVACRMVPDVAALSGDIATNGFATTRGGAPNQQGSGTSLSSPLWAGIWARVQSAAPHHGTHQLGFANPYLYSLVTAPGAAAVASTKPAFLDIGGGASSPPTSNGLYPTTPGYDYVTGLGVPDVAGLIARVDSSRRGSLQ